ncbi:sulfate transporter family protein [Mycobacterium xenopi 3993]|nr:sulfate transporter family protein [Mycobacterium xenopi 3993]
MIVRSSTNIHAGAKVALRRSCTECGAAVLVAVRGLVEQIPTAALAGLLIVIGIRLLQPAHIETARRNGDFVVYLVTVLASCSSTCCTGTDRLALAIALTGWRVIRPRSRPKSTPTTNGTCG